MSISGNRFILAPKNNPLVHVENSDDIAIDNNTIVSFSPEHDVAVNGVPQPPPLVYVQSGLNVHGAGNTTQEATARQAVAIEPGSHANLQWNTTP